MPGLVCLAHFLLIAVFLLGCAKLPKNDPTQSCQWFNKGVELAHAGEYPQALQAFDQATRFNPDNYHAWLEKGITLMHLIKYEQALCCFDKALAVKPDYLNALHMKGMCLNDQGRLPEAIQCYDKIIALKPDYALAWYDKGYILTNLERHREALECFDKIIKLIPNYPNLWLARGFSLDELGYEIEALECYEKILEIKRQTLSPVRREKNPELVKGPDFGGAWYLNGLIIRDPQKALKTYQDNLAKNPHDFWGWLFYGMSMEDLGRYQDAIKAHERVIALKPDYARAWFEKAGILELRLGDFKQALKCYEAMVDNKRKSVVSSLLGKGIALRKERKFKEALVSFEQAITLKPAEAMAWYQKGLTLQSLGKPQAALTALQKTSQLAKQQKNEKLLSELKTLSPQLPKQP